MNETDKLIRSFYTSVVEEEWEQFRPNALAQLCRHLGASAAAWVTHSAGAVYGEFTLHPAGLAATPHGLLALPFGNAAELTLGPDRCVPGTRHGLALNYAHCSGSLTSIVALWFSNGQKAFPPDSARRVVMHMVEAGALALQEYIQRDEWLYNLGRPNRGTAALVDASGTVYAASRRFRGLIADEYGSADFGALPFLLPEEAFCEHGLFSQGPLRFRTAKADGNLYLLHARKPMPLDGLSPREQEIARALGHGKTFKTVARQCGIAVSTVANHASRIYRKLGIYRREDLVELIRTPSDSAQH